MPPTLTSIAHELGQLATQLTWQQWGALGAQTNDSAPYHQAAIDPEALLLMSLALLEHEKRLADVISSWITLNSDLLSVQRVRNLARTFPAAAQESLSAVATTAIMEAKDLRWRSVLRPGEQTALAARAGKLRATKPAFMLTATLMLQLRQGMGVGVKADVFAFLLTSYNHGRDWASATAMARALGYTSAAIGRNADDLAAARFIHKMQSVEDAVTSTRMYMADPGMWGNPLRIGNIQSGWRYWKERFGFIADVLEQGQKLEAAHASEFAVANACRKLLERHRMALYRDVVDAPMTLDASADPVAALHQASSRMAEWLRNNP